jgi:hypothetical protein
LEAKNVGFASASRWHADIPDRILAQILHQLYVTGYKHAHYACLVGGNTMRQGIVYAARESETTEFIVGEVERFRTEYLLTRTEPPWDTTDKAAKLLEMDAISHPDRVGEIGIDEIGDVMDYALLSRAAGDAKKELEVARARLAQLANGHEIVTFANKPAFRYGPSTRTHVDLDRLPRRRDDARHVRHQDLLHLGRHALPVHQGEARQVCRLRRPWHHCLRTVARVRQLLRRHGRAARGSQP